MREASGRPVAGSMLGLLCLIDVVLGVAHLGGSHASPGAGWLAIVGGTAAAFVGTAALVRWRAGALPRVVALVAIVVAASAFVVAGQMSADAFSCACSGA